jgi:hypothetical protein
MDSLWYWKGMIRSYARARTIALSHEAVRMMMNDTVHTMARMVYSKMPVLIDRPIAKLANHPPEGAS